MAKSGGAKEKKENVHRKFADAEAFQRAIDAYFAEEAEKGRIVSVQGMTLRLGITASTFDNYWMGRTCPDLQETAILACQRMAVEYFQLLNSGNKGVVPFVIFLLKQKYFGGFTDKIEQNTEMNVNVKFGAGMDESDFR